MEHSENTAARWPAREGGQWLARGVCRLLAAAARLQRSLDAAAADPFAR